MVSSARRSPSRWAESSRENPFLAAQVLTFTAIPSLRIRERGLWDVRKGQPVPLIAEEEGV
jgi:adenine deaminase